MNTTDIVTLIGAIVAVAVPLAGFVWYIVNHPSEWKKIFSAGIITIFLIAIIFVGVKIIVGPGSTPSPSIVVRYSAGPQDSNAFGHATASCQGNEIMIGGGFTKDTQASLVISANYPSDKNSWTVSYSYFHLPLPFGSPTPHTPTPPRVLATAYALCLTFSRSIETAIVPGGSVHMQGGYAAQVPDAQCPANYTILSGGYTAPGGSLQFSGLVGASYPSSSSTWHVEAVLRPGDNLSSGDYQAYALCGKGPLGGQPDIIPGPFSVPADSSLHHEYVGCPLNQFATGGGFQIAAPLFASSGPQQNYTQWAIDTTNSSGTIYVVCNSFQ